jgi:hypothetical protein
MPSISEIADDKLPQPGVIGAVIDEMAKQPQEAE